MKEQEKHDRGRTHIFQRKITMVRMQGRFFWFCFLVSGLSLKGRSQQQASSSKHF